MILVICLFSFVNYHLITGKLRSLFNFNFVSSLESTAINLTFGKKFFANIIFQFVDYLLNMLIIPLKHRLTKYFAIRSVGFHHGDFFHYFKTVITLEFVLK